MTHTTQTASKYRIEKQGYSRGAWRVLYETGEQVWEERLFDHPQMGATMISGPVCFDRKRDAAAWIAADALERQESEKPAAVCDFRMWNPNQFTSWPHIGPCGRPAEDGSQFCGDHHDDGMEGH